MLFFAALAIPFLALVVIEVALLALVGWLGSRDNFAGVLVGVIFVALSLHLFGALDIVTPIVQHPGTTLGVVAAYFALALPVAQKFLWRNYLIRSSQRDLENIDAIRAKFYEERRAREDEAAAVTERIEAVTRGDADPGSAAYEPFTDVRDRVFETSRTEYEGAFADFWENGMSPKADDNKARILSYMAYWPVLSVHALVGDYLLRVFARMFDAFKDSFNKDAARRYVRSYEKATTSTQEAK